MFIAAMALPKQVVLVPLVRMVNFMGIHDTLAAVILPLRIIQNNSNIEFLCLFVLLFRYSSQFVIL